LSDRSSSFVEESLRIHGIDWLVVFAYFDATYGGDSNDRLTAVAGYLFGLEGATMFRQFYDSRIDPLVPPDPKKGNQKIFHSAACFDGSDPYFGIQRPIRECILARMAEAIRQSVTLGCIVAIEDSQWDLGQLGRYGRLKVAGAPADMSHWVGSKYSLCLLRCIQGIADWMTQHGLEGPVEYVIESGDEDELQAAEMLSRASGTDLAKRLKLNKHSFARKDPETPGLFAPDYLAWEWQRMDRIAADPAAGEWRTVILDAMDTKPHIGSYLTEQSISVQSLVNAFHGLRRHDD
jgi:hypothetical protein